MRARTTVSEVAAAAMSATAGHMYGSGRLGQRRHTRGIDYYAPLGTGPETFAAHRLLVSQSDVDDAALTAVHRVEAEWRAGPLDLIGRGEGAHA